MKKRITAMMLCAHMVLFMMFQVASVVMAEDGNTAIEDDVAVAEDIAVVAEEEEGLENENSPDWISYEDFMLSETTKAWNDPATYVRSTAEFNVNRWDGFEVTSGFTEDGFSNPSEFISYTELSDEDGKGLKVVITDFYHEKEADLLWYKVEAAEGYTLPDILVDNPYVLHLPYAEEEPALLMLPKKGMFVGETVIVQKQMVAASAYRELTVSELPEFFDIAWADDNVLDELEWYDLGDISGWSEELTPEYRYVSASSVILIPAEVSRAYEALMDADGTDQYYAIMSFIPEEVTAQFTDRHIANLEKRVEYLQEIENVEYTTNATIGGKEVPITVHGKIPQEGVTLTVEEVTTEDVLSGGFDIKDASEIVTALDIKIINDGDGSEWQPEEGGQISVSFDMEALGYEDNEIFRLHHKHGENIEVFEVLVVMDGELTVRTNGFSLYVISNFNDFDQDAPGTNGVQLANPGNNQATAGSPVPITLTVGQTVVYYASPRSTTEQNVGNNNYKSTWWVTDPEGAIYYEIYSDKPAGSYGVNGRWIRVTALKETEKPITLRYLYTDDIPNQWSNGNPTISQQYYNLSIVVPKPDAVEDPDGYKLYIEDRVNTSGVITATLVDSAGNKVVLDNESSYSWERDDGAYIVPTAYKDGGKSVDICVDHGGLLQSRLDNVTYTVSVTLPNGREKTASYTVYYQSEIINSTFESPKVTGGTYTFLTNGWPNLYWKTTSPGTGINLSRDIEYARYNNNGQITGTDFFPSKAGDGMQFAELNAENFGALYQDIITAPEEIVSWEFLHAKRNPEDDGEAMFLIMGPTEYAQEVTDYNELSALIDDILEQNGGRNKAIAAMANSNSIKYTEVINRNGVDVTVEYQVWYHSADGDGRSQNDAWTFLEGEYKVPKGQYRTRLFFVTDPKVAKQLNYGNLIDSSRAGQYKKYLIEYYEESYVMDANGATILQYTHMLDATKEKYDEDGEAIMYSSVVLENFEHFEKDEHDLLATVLINGENSPYNIKYSTKPCLFIENYSTKVDNVRHFDTNDQKLNDYSEYDIVMQVFFRDTIIAVQKWVEFPKIKGTDTEALTAIQKQTLVDGLIKENGKGYLASFHLDCNTESNHFADNVISITKNDPAGWYTGYIPIGDNPDGEHNFKLIEESVSPLDGLEIDKVTFEYYKFFHGERTLEKTTKYENVVLEEVTDGEETKYKLVANSDGTKTDVFLNGIDLSKADESKKLAEIKVTNTYKEKEVKINYVAVGNGLIAVQDDNIMYEKSDSETFLFYSGKPQGVRQKPDENYTFAGWYLDEACTIPVDENHGYVDVSGEFIPNKAKTISDNVLEVTYYAKFSIGSLQIIREDAEPGQVFVYEVKDAYGNTMYVTVEIGSDGKGSTEIVNASFGNNNSGLDYTVTQLNSWSWRYNSNTTSVTKTHKETTGLHGAQNMTTVFRFPDDLESTEQTSDYWLNGNSDVLTNTYGGGAN